MTPFPQPRQEYTPEEIRSHHLIELFLAFEQGFRRYLKDKVRQWPHVSQELEQRFDLGTFLGLTQEEVPRIVDSPNFNRYKGDLEAACAAAKHLAYRYDIGLGIAKKGVWLSYVFSLFGLKTADILAIRGPRGVFCSPLDPLYSRDIAGKRVLLFDNDVVTGATVKTVSSHLRKARPSRIDILLVYGHTEVTPEYYSQIKDSFKGTPITYGNRDGKEVIDARCEIDPYVKKVFTVAEYDASMKKLIPLARILKVDPPQ